MKNSILILISFISFFSCEKDDINDNNMNNENVTTEENVEEEILSFNKSFLLNEEWVLKSITSSIPLIENKNVTVPSTDILSQSGDCILDDTIIFDEDKNIVTVNDNNNNCDTDLYINGFLYVTDSVFFDFDNNDNITSITFSSGMPGIYCNCREIINVKAMIIDGKKIITGQIITNRAGVSNVVYDYTLTTK